MYCVHSNCSRSAAVCGACELSEQQGPHSRTTHVPANRRSKPHLIVHNAPLPHRCYTSHQQQLICSHTRHKHGTSRALKQTLDEEWLLPGATAT